MVMMSSKRRVARLSKMILSSSVRVGGGVRMGRIVMDDAGEDSVEVIVIVPVVISGVVVMVVRVVRLGGAAVFFMVSVFSVATGFALSSRAFACWAFKRSFLLQLFLLSWSHRAGCIGRE